MESERESERERDWDGSRKCPPAQGRGCERPICVPLRLTSSQGTESHPLAAQPTEPRENEKMKKKYADGITAG